MFLDDLFLVHCAWCRICQSFITWMVSSNDCGASTSSALVGQRGRVWRATWAFQIKVRCGQRVKASGSASVVVLQSSTHLQCMCWCSLSKSLMHFISVGLIEPPCLVVFYSSTALLLAPSSCSMKRERGGHVSQLCRSGPALWEEELLLFKALYGFCFFI